MTLDVLANEIATQAKAEAELIIADAEQQAKKIEDEAKSEAMKFSQGVQSRAERESSQLSVELVASAKQANQKHLLIAKREELDNTWETIRSSVGSPNLEGRSNILSELLSESFSWLKFKFFGFKSKLRNSLESINSINVSLSRSSNPLCTSSK